MAEDNLAIIDVENAVLSGIIKEKQKGDPRGNKYVIHGSSDDGSTLIVYPFPVRLPVSTKFDFDASLPKSTVKKNNFF